MNFKEAYALLEIPEGSSKEDAKKAFKKLAAKCHPDVCKEPDAENKFKKINEAYQVIESGKSTDPGQQGNWSSYGHASSPFDIQDILNDMMGRNSRSPFARHQYNIRATDIYMCETISFREAVIGYKKEIKYSRNIACKKCDGLGSITLDNGCKLCGGRGRTVTARGPMLVDQTCSACFGKIKTESCSECNSTAYVKTETSISVNIPPGIFNGNVLRLGGMGNYSGTMSGYTSVLLTLTVIEDPGLKIQDKDVLTELHISLLEALQGCKKKVKTIDGEKEINIDALTKNKDEVILSKLGVAKIGNERVIIHVDYPTYCRELIEVLNKKKEN
jgi:molecular chaperone DnaJ